MGGRMCSMAVADGPAGGRARPRQLPPAPPGQARAAAHRALRRPRGALSLRVRAPATPSGPRRSSRRPPRRSPGQVTHRLDRGRGPRPSGQGSQVATHRPGLGRRPALSRGALPRPARWGNHGFSCARPGADDFMMRRPEPYPSAAPRPGTRRHRPTPPRAAPAPVSRRGDVRRRSTPDTGRVQRRLASALIGVMVGPLVATMWLAGGSNAGVAFAATTTVRPGDTLSAIAQRYGTTVSALAAANGITNRNQIYAGTTLQVPGPPPVARAASGPSAAAAVTPGGTVAVRSGDTLSSIAARYHTTVAALIVGQQDHQSQSRLRRSQAHAARVRCCPRVGDRGGRSRPGCWPIPLAWRCVPPF